jgi:hypothetical protein
MYSLTDRVECNEIISMKTFMEWVYKPYLKNEKKSDQYLKTYFASCTPFIDKDMSVVIQKCTTSMFVSFTLPWKTLPDKSHHSIYTYYDSYTGVDKDEVILEVNEEKKPKAIYGILLHIFQGSKKSSYI